MLPDDPELGRAFVAYLNGVRASQGELAEFVTSAKHARSSLVGSAMRNRARSLQP